MKHGGRRMVVGLTGGVATGKSLVTAELKRLGALVVDADVIAREVVSPGTPAFEEIAREFGPSVMAGGAIDRKALAEVVFSDGGRLKALNRITHPRILERIREEVGALKKVDAKAIIVIDAALLMETGLDNEVEKTVVVAADEAVQIERIRRRDGLDRAGALKRIRSQTPLAEKIRRADRVIDNNGSVEDTKASVAALYNELRASLR